MDFLQPYLPQAVAALAVVAVILFIMVLSTNSRLARTQRMLRGVLSGPGGEDLEALLKRSVAESRDSLVRCDEQDARIEELASTLRGCVQQIGLVRFDAFNDVAGGQSFSLALLDSHQNGIVVTSLLGRTDGRCFGKAVFAGQAEQPLSDEETEALQMAMRGTFASGAGAARAAEKPGRREKNR